MKGPLSVDLSINLHPTLATGADLKAGFCLAKGSLGWLFYKTEDLAEYRVFKEYIKRVEEAKERFGVEPEIVACDLHPEYRSTRFAHQNRVQTVSVQHHYAHIVSCMTENRVAEKVIGVALDGTGYGEDGNIWGFELLVADLTGFERMGHLKPIPAPGGDRAAREPWRMATSYLFSVFGEDFDERWKKEETEMLFAMIKKNINSPLTSSCGRLFDAVSAILGLCERAEYEAEAAIALERVAEDSVDGEYKYEIKEGDLLVIDPSLTIRGVVEDVDHRVREGVISAKFHNTLSKMVADLCTKIRDKTKIEKIALSGGCFQNLYLKKRVKKVLKDLGFSVYLHNTVPTHDGGISLGQAVVAGRCV